MKRILLSSLICTFLAADEITRIESIVNDITKLRSEYEKCQAELEAKPKQNIVVTKQTQEINCIEQDSQINSLKYSLKDEKEKNIILQEDIEKIANTQKKEMKLKDNLYKNLEQKYNDMLLLKNKEIESLKNQIKSTKKSTKEPKVQHLIISSIEEKPNPFPKLLLKEQYRDLAKKETPIVVSAANINITKLQIEETTKVEKQIKAEKPVIEIKAAKAEIPKPKQEIQIEIMEPSTFRLNKDSDIFNSVDGKVVYNWEEGRSFTSNQRYKGWIKITGYFLDKKWLRAKEELWVLEKNSFKR